MLNERLAHYGRWTYRGAWGLEIIASAIGLATGVALGIQAYSSSETVATMELVLASAPFLMVALAELTKIPIATLMFVASWVWKPVLIIALLALAMITFFTVFLGLERAKALREEKYNDFIQQIKVLELDRKAAAEQVVRLENPHIILDRQGNLDDYLEQSRAEKEPVEETITRLEAKINSADSLPPAYRRLQERLQSRQEEIDRIVKQRDSELETRGNEFESQRESYLRRIKDFQESDPDAARRWQGELRRLKDPRPAIRAKYDPKIEALESERGALRVEQENVPLDADNPATAGVRAELKTAQDGLAAIDARWAPRIAEARELLTNATEEAADRTDELEEARTRLDEIDREISVLESKRVPLARTDQVRRLAGWWFGVGPEEATAEQVSLVGLIYFSSLAGLAALAGPITAIVALGLQATADRRMERREGRLARYLRKWLIRWRYRRVRTIEKPVEVFVDREVEKIVEVPRDVIREVEKRVEVPREVVTKEIVYIPLLTDDPDLVRKLMPGDLPPDLADLVQVRRAEAQN